MASIMNRSTIAILFSIIFLISGCSLKIPNSPNVSYNNHVKLDKRKTKLLVKRFIEYWDSRIKGDAKRSWEYELPYQRYLTPFDDYRRLLSGYAHTKIELADIHFLDPDTAIITRKVHTKRKTYQRKDRWIYVKDNWYHKFYQSVLPPETVEEADFQ